MGQRRPLGEGDATVPADDRVPLAGRAHRARDRGRGAGRDAEDSGALQGFRRDRAGDAGGRRAEEREREVRRGVEDLLDRGADGRRPRAAGRHLAQPRSELRQGLRDPVPGARQDAAARLDDVVGRLDADDRRPDHDARRRQRPDPAAARRAVSGGDRPDPPRQLAGDGPAQGPRDRSRADAARRARDARRPRRLYPGLEVRGVGAAGRAGPDRDRSQGPREVPGRRGAARHAGEVAAADGQPHRRRWSICWRRSSRRCSSARGNSARTTRRGSAATTSSRARWRGGPAS